MSGVIVPRSRTRQITIDNTKQRWLALPAGVPRKKIVIQNKGGAAIEFGPNDVLVGVGIEVGSGGNYIDDAQGSVYQGDVYLATASAAGLDVRVREEWDEER